MNKIAYCGLCVMVLTASIFGDTISGVITAASDGSPLEGVKVSSGAEYVTYSDAEGYYELITNPAGSAILGQTRASASKTFWNIKSNMFVWNENAREVNIGVWDVNGRLIDHYASQGRHTQNSFTLRIPVSGMHLVSVTIDRNRFVYQVVRMGNQPLMVKLITEEHLESDRSLAGFLGKVGAQNDISYELTGYLTQNQQVWGSQSELDIQMQSEEIEGEWRQSRLTYFTSYPDPNSDECLYFSGCEYVGLFSALDEQVSEEWVSQHNIIAVHEKDYDTYKLKTLRLRSGDNTIDAVVYDECADSDCGGCCSENASETGFLIDAESYTADRFGVHDADVIEWMCIDCN